VACLVVFLSTEILLLGTKLLDFSKKFCTDILFTKDILEIFALIDRTLFLKELLELCTNESNFKNILLFVKAKAIFEIFETCFAIALFTEREVVFALLICLFILRIRELVKFETAFVILLILLTTELLVLLIKETTFCCTLAVSPKNAF
jgi:hypothetical protein